MAKKILFGLMWLVIIFIVSYMVTGIIVVLFAAGAETNRAKYEVALAFRHTYMIFFAIGSLIIVALGTVTGILPGTKHKSREQKKSIAKKKTRKKSQQ
jgi:cytochrome b subunit of formate dehydrogenase